MRKLRTSSTLAPITPAIPESPVLPSSPRPIVTPDTRTERILFEMYVEQKELCAEWQAKFERLQMKIKRMDSRFTRFRTRGTMRRLAAALTHVPLTKKPDEVKP